jgi:hypothetical protein
LEEAIDAAFDLAAFLPGNTEDFGNANHPSQSLFIDLRDRHGHLGAMKYCASFSRFRHHGGQLLAGL